MLPFSSAVNLNEDWEVGATSVFSPAPGSAPALPARSISVWQVGGRQQLPVECCAV